MKNIYIFWQFLFFYKTLVKEIFQKGKSVVLIES